MILRTIKTMLFLLPIVLIACNGGKKGGSEETMTSEQPTKTKDKQMPEEKMSDAKKATAILESKSGSGLVGSVTFEQKDGKVMMKADLEHVMPAGKHAIHIHEKGDCSASDGTSAGGHWNPTNNDHGKWGEAPFHVGDIGNLTADDDGKSSFEHTTDMWCLGCDDPNKNIIDKAIIVHEGPDDFTSQPSGAAGPRIGCGVIEMQ